MRGKDLTDREKIVLLAAAAAERPISPSLLYRAAYPGKEEECPKPSGLPATASRWIRSDRVATFLRDEKAAFEARLERIRQEAINEYKTKMALTTDNDTGLPDYTLPQNQVREINRIINDSTDVKDRLDGLKLLISQQRTDTEAAKTQQVQRYYMPIRCSSCVLYSMADDVLKLHSAQRYNTQTPESKAKADEALRAGGREIIKKYFDALIKRHK